MSIVKLGSFSEAAQQLGYTQSSVTSHIQLLEKELGTRLFERLGHSLMLTADGERLYGYAERMVRLDDEAHAELERQTEPEGILSLGMSESIASYHLNQVLTEYVRLYPKVKLRLQLGIGSSFTGLLRRNLLDIAFFLEGKVRNHEFTAHCLWPEPIVLSVAPTHGLAKRTRVTEKDLAGQTLILTDVNSRYTSQLSDSLAKKKVEPDRVLEIGQVEAARQFAMQGIGVAVLPLAVVRTEIAAGHLVRLPWQGLPWEMHAYMVHHRDKWLSLPMKLFMKLVHERLSEAGGDGREQ